MTARQSRNRARDMGDALDDALRVERCVAGLLTAPDPWPVIDAALAEGPVCPVIEAYRAVHHPTPTDGGD